MALPLQAQKQEVRKTALRPVLSGGRWFWPLAILFAIPGFVAVYAFFTQMTHGLGVTGLNNQVFWGLYITNLVTFIGFSYGGALVSAILRLTGQTWRAPITRLAEATALVTLLIGALFIFMDMGRPDRVWEFLVRPNGSSPLVWDAAAVTTYLVATIIFLYLPMIPDLAAALHSSSHELGGFRRKLYKVLSAGWTGGKKQERVLNWGMTTMAVMIIPIAVVVHSVLSWAFALSTREGWHSTIFGPYFVIGALFSGVAMVILVVLAFRKVYRLEQYIPQKAIVRLGYILLTLGLTYLYFTFTELLTEGYPMVEKSADLFQTLFLGGYATQFWTFVVAGGIVPILLIALPWTRNNWGIGIASALVAGDMWLKRLLIIVPPQMVPLVSGDLGHYHPTWVEYAITAGGLFAIPLLLMLFFRIFPILSIFEVEEEIEGHGSSAHS